MEKQKNQQDKGTAADPKTGAAEEQQTGKPKVLHYEPGEYDMVFEATVRLFGTSVEITNFRAFAVIPMGLHPGFVKETEPMIKMLYDQLVMKPLLFAWREYLRTHPEIMKSDGEAPLPEVEITTPLGTFRVPDG